MHEPPQEAGSIKNQRNMNKCPKKNCMEGNKKRLGFPIIDGALIATSLHPNELLKKIGYTTRDPTDTRTSFLIN